ncbi:hypothetical protein KSS87_001098 [Heliosperma pusillum]|nr:hypothetical protein KSS87_001098 [Heliosperma pusillum]
MIMFMKSASCRRVSNEDLNENNKYLEYYYRGSSDNKNVDPSIILTVWRKSLLVSCSGFTVIDSKGNLVYRVDNYCGRRPAEIVLMDGFGKSVLTMRRHKKLTLGNDWGIYKGEASDQIHKQSHKKQTPIGYIRKNVTLLQGNANVLAQVYIGTTSKKPTYVIEGSYDERCCKVFDKLSKTMVAEVKRKEAVNGGASFGLDVFQLVVVPGFDAGFAMALVLLLDQMYG